MSAELAAFNRSDIEDVPVNRLAAFYHKYYRPDSAVLNVLLKHCPRPT